MGALDGMLVVSLEQAVAAPYATRLLAEAGARVIKIERQEGDFARGYDRAAKGLSSYFVWLNHGKDSIVLDLKAEADRALLERILGHADVFVQNLAPGAAERLDLGQAALEERFPRLVTCSISGFGDEGPYATRKGYDLVVQAETGLAAVTGSPDAPGRVGISICDISTGLAAYAAILEALIARGRTGSGTALRLSLFDTIAEWMTAPYLHARYGQGAPARVGLAHPSIAPYGTYPTHGAPILLAIQNGREWQRFCDIVMADPAFAADPRFESNVARTENRVALDALVGARFVSLERDALVALLERADLVFGTVNEVADFLAHPQLRQQVVETEAGEIAMPASAVKRSGASVPAPRRVPAIGQDGARIRAEFAENARDRVEQDT